jgi:hypothetical protein
VQQPFQIMCVGLVACQLSLQLLNRAHLAIQGHLPRPASNALPFKPAEALNAAKNCNLAPFGLGKDSMFRSAAKQG